MENAHRARSQFDHSPTLCHSYVSTVSFTPESAPSSSFCRCPVRGFKCMMRFLNPGFICSNSSSFKQVRDFSAARHWHTDLPRGPQVDLEEPRDLNIPSA